MSGIYFNCACEQGTGRLLLSEHGISNCCAHCAWRYRPNDLLKRQGTRLLLVFYSFFIVLISIAHLATAIDAVQALEWAFFGMIAAVTVMLTLFKVRQE